MNFAEVVKSGLRNYANFHGRATRSEFWYWALFSILMSIGAALIDVVLFPDSGILAPVGTIGALALLLPNLAVSARRLQDRDYIGWYHLMFFVPFVGGIFLLVMFCLPGEIGPNRFGPDPLGADAASTSAAAP